ncbi:FACT complex subunit Ssrp1-like [Homarus americanus]|uniref:FACT complex subunit SSRP1 n=1 Tax=Homarus americanus TaxID=6706 RepID=A0A8J5MUG5_HOMAM|nr:FACT complex subunit Ssrp1-like [Homarus americanus]XP_042232121.1 FACT complex subunit Ssrp1-like [Homarus americanus]XP_042232122.1 FACT complex subunit Ssrp1-like [Homarus americanus]XP_042232123.1 FACT complex subunit Ssrp1-like [Homarus americanus]KAG7163414.1 FACT complex subunit SSRP1-like 1 [Homarus americanus]
MKEEVPVLEYTDVTIESRGLMVPVRLKLTDQGITFRNVKTGKVETLNSSDIEVVNWQRLSGSYGIRIFTENGSLFRFGGFKESEQSKLEKFFKNTYSKTMSEKEFSVKGWNYGAAKFEGAVLSFDVSSIPAFEVPLSHVSGCTTGKNEVTLEFHQHDDAAINLMEMRFHIPTSELAGDDPVESFQQRVMAKASVITATGDALAIFREVQCLTPRGRYDIKVYPSFIQLHGKTFDFKIPVTTVLRLFLLPHLDQRQHFFVVSLDPPIKQGQTRYPYLILLFSGDDTDLLELPLSEEELHEKYEGRLDKEMSGPQFELISKMFKGICNRKIVTPGNFMGHSGTPAISCSYKAAAGYLYPLERGIIYVHKPPVHIRFDEISSVNFARSGSTTRSFDFEVEVKNGLVNTFSSIEKGEYNRLFDYVNQKKLRIKNRGKMEMGSRKDDFDNSDADEPDPYMRRVREEAKERDQDDDEEDSSEDEDFAPGEEGSDVAEEYDSYAGDSSDSGDSEGGLVEGGEKKKKEKRERKQKSKTVSEKPRKRRQKKERDENKPKRAQSAYFLWLNEHREQIKKENPGISITEISKVAGQKWRALEDKTEWEKKAAEAKQEYEEAMKAYKISVGGSSSGTPKKSPSQKKVPVSVTPTKAGGSGAGFKSKEFIEDDSSDDDKPLKKKAKKETKNEKEESEEEEEEEEESSNASDKEEDSE